MVERKKSTKRKKKYKFSDRTPIQKTLQTFFLIYYVIFLFLFLRKINGFVYFFILKIFPNFSLNPLISAFILFTPVTYLVVGIMYLILKFDFEKKNPFIVKRTLLSYFVFFPLLIIILFLIGSPLVLD